MSYGKEWEKYPIEKGEVWESNTVKIMVADLTKSMPSFIMKADMIYCDPPWELRNVNMFNSKSGRDYMNHFSEFYTPLFDHIKNVNAKVCYLEVGKKELELFKSKLGVIFKYIQVWEIKYYKKHPCFLIRGCENKTNIDFTGIDDEHTPLLAIKTESPKCVLDFCTGRGLTGIAAIKQGCNFVGTELNKRKLAVFINRANKLGNEVKKNI